MLSKCDLLQSSARLTKPDCCILQSHKNCCFISLSSPSDLPTPPGVSIGHGDLQQRSEDGWMYGRHARVGDGWKCGESQLACRAPLVAWMRSYELLTAFNSEIVIAYGSFITTGRQESKQRRWYYACFHVLFSKKEQERALNIVSAVDAEQCLLSMWMYALGVLSLLY